MRVLVDTRMLVWMFMDSPMLSSAARDLLQDYGNRLYCSAASVLEVQLKHEKSPRSIVDAKSFLECCEEADVTVLPISGEHASAIADLPKIHKDPFDRLMIAQAQVEGMHLLTHDSTIWKYDLPFVIEA